jgi:hypothetical protein
MDATGASALAMGVALLGCSDDGIANQSGGGVTGNGSGLTADGDDAGDDGGDTGTAATSGGSTGGAAEASTGSSGSDGGSTGATGDTGSTDTGSTDTGSTDTGSTGTGSTDTGGSDSGGSSDSGGNMCPPANGIGIGSDCAGGGVCPDCLTCQPFVGFVLQETCQILCAGPADCPPGYNCVMAVDKTGVPWQQCEP